MLSTDKTGKLFTPRPGAPKHDPSKRVRVYKNLHRTELEGVPVFSIQQDGKVIGYSPTCWLQEAKFVIQKSGQERVRREQRKNVHAFVDGFLVKPKSFVPIYIAKYDPYKNDTFVDASTGEPIYEALVACVGRLGVYYYD